MKDLEIASEGRVIDSLIDRLSTEPWETASVGVRMDSGIDLNPTNARVTVSLGRETVSETALLAP